MPSRLRVSEWERNGKEFHSYYLDGKYVPGVTTCARLGGGSTDGLVNWAVRLTAEAAYEFRNTELNREQYLSLVSSESDRQRDAAADFGKVVHKYARKILGGETITVPDEYAGHVQQIINFLDETEAEEIIAEQPVYSAKYRYGGKPDGILRLADKRIWEIDYKTGNVWPTAALQLAGYRFAECYVDKNGDDQEMGNIDECAVVHIRSDSWELIPVAAGPSVFQHFLRCRKLWEFTRMKREDLIGQPLSTLAG